MQKEDYKKELTITGTQKPGGPNNKKDVKKIQSWLTLFDIAKPGSGTTTGIDGDYGNATQKAVINYQKAKGLPQTAVTDAALFAMLTEPLVKAFEGNVTGNGLRQRILNVAKMHLDNKPYELTIEKQSNSGPWVRSYMGGNEGEPWFWCMGFVQSIIDQAATSMGKNFKTLMPLTFSCDTLGTFGIQKKLLTRFTDVRKNSNVVKPGDIFLLQKTPNDWFHTGLVTGVGDGIFETIEGNTNDDGSHNGNRVCKRIRNFMQGKLDVFSIEPLV